MYNIVVMKFKKIIGHFVDIDENDKVNKEILEKHITHYMAGVGQVLAVTFFLIMIFEIVVILLIKSGHFLTLLKNHYGQTINYKDYIMTHIFYELSVWATFLIYFVIWKKANFTVRKILTTFLSLLLTSFFCFYHWKNSSLSILYVLPVIIAIPLDKKRNKAVIFFSIIMILTYSIFQFSINRSDSNFIIAINSITTVIALQLISIKIHNTMNRAFLDIKSYAQKQEILYDKLTHDELTGSYSKSALETEIKDLSTYKTLSFIDIDNFKKINDSYGHHMGDEILKLLVFCLTLKGSKIYRYGGDEFIILSTFTAEELFHNLKKLKTKFSFYASDLYEITASISIGIITINHTESGLENIKRCDNLMYISKEKGKDTLTVG